MHFLKNVPYHSHHSFEVNGCKIIYLQSLRLIRNLGRSSCRKVIRALDVIAKQVFLSLSQSLLQLLHCKCLNIG